MTLGISAQVHTVPKTSTLWGEKGEHWSDASRLPDFSHAGYREGEMDPPELPQVANVRDFGAKGDGKHDDTDAFLKAIAESKPGAIFVPPGRYKITRILTLNRSGTVLRGAGPDQTKLVCPVPLETIRPNPGATTSGKPTSNYSWSGGIVEIRGQWHTGKPVAITNPARRGDRMITVAKDHSFQPGDRLRIEATDDDVRSLLSHIYSGDTGSTGKIPAPLRIQIYPQIEKIEGSTITLDRPLRIDLDLKWKPTIREQHSSVSESGIESLGFEFPNQPYGGHFSELGFNAITLVNVEDCWVSNIQIHNADSGIFSNGLRCSMLDITITSERKQDGQKCTGHHGITMGHDSLCSGFDIQTRFIHDFTLTNFRSGSVISDGKAKDLSIDHHRKGPFENLITDVDAGQGTRLWKCGGGRDLGKHCAARGTFWNIRTAIPQTWPPKDFGPDSMNLVGLTTTEPSDCRKDGRWFEAIPPEQLQPQNLHEAQLARRLKAKAK